jgi:D-alanyl-lipoteichoic acid acyltransferase DltB (MBOAT superfamily)
VIFTSLDFFHFFSILIVLLWLVKKWVDYRVCLLAGSLFFYASWNPYFLSLLLASTLVDYVLGLKIHRCLEEGKRKGFLFLSLFFNLGSLFFFKYLVFIDGVVKTLFHLSGEPLNIILPLGISFYTFQTLSYSIDIYRRKLEPCSSFVDFALYVTFFPQLVAGPIVRAASFLPQIRNHLHFSFENAAFALERFIWGMSKKLLIADPSASFVNIVYADPEHFSGKQIFVASMAFAVQLYVDFSAYSDMAIALARFFGFRIDENFNNPYFARNIREFWSRWHVSLSTWLRDYLYISLGGNRGGRWRTLRNLLVTMILGGFWHGAAWGFLIWGFYHGLLLVADRFLSEVSWPDFLKRGFTFFFVLIGWVFFRAENFQDVVVIFQKLWGFVSFQDQAQRWLSLKPAAFMVACTFLGGLFYEMKLVSWQKLYRPVRAFFIVLILWMTLAFSSGEAISFYYFIF